jgi:hypothetical protein
MEDEILKPLSFFSITPILHDSTTPEDETMNRMARKGLLVSDNGTAGNEGGRCRRI